MAKGQVDRKGSKQGIIRDYPVGYKKPPKTSRFKPGQSGNPHGRPKSHPELRELIQSIAEEAPSKKNRQTRIEVLVRKMLTSKSAKDRQNILEHGWGKVPQTIDLNLGTELMRKAQELGIDWKSDPILVAIFAAAGITNDRASEDEGTGGTSTGEPERGGSQAGVSGQ